MTEAAILPAKGVFIDNEWVASASGGTIDVIAPAEGVKFAEIAAGNKADVDRAVAAARAALAGDWGKLSATERGRLLTRLGLRIAEVAEELAQLESRDTGKPLTQARNDMVATARYFEYYGGAADKVHGDTIPFMPGYFVTTEHVPHGVTGHIIPWNYPAQMFGRTVGPALAMGNACVVKPAEDACLTRCAWPNWRPRSAFLRARSTSCRDWARRRATRCPIIRESTSSRSPAARRSAR
ncbi:aldehyde dehydrogenase family protein [Sphingomonas sp. I4]